MGRTYKVGPSGTFGSRYGTVARKRYAAIVSALRAPSECPQCHITAVQRVSVGIWLCSRCGFKFAGGAFAPMTKLGEVAERAARAGLASGLAAQLRSEKAEEAESKRKATAKRRRRKAEARTSKLKGAAEDKAP